VRLGENYAFGRCDGRFDVVGDHADVTCRFVARQVVMSSSASVRKVDDSVDLLHAQPRELVGDKWVIGNDDSQQASILSNG